MYQLITHKKNRNRKKKEKKKTQLISNCNLRIS